MQENETGTAPLNGGSYNAELKPEARKPRDVLRDMMIFYDTQAKDIITEIIVRLKEETQHARGSASDLAMMFKKFAEASEIAIRCAEKLAPYEHPKLESIEVKKELTHRFVLRAPVPNVDIKQWLEMAKAEQNQLAIKNKVVDVTPEEPKPTYEAAVDPKISPPKRPLLDDEEYPEDEDDGIYIDDDDENEDL